ncbi:MAG: hypothetical protein US25_C0073G0003 [Candidatus Moranbacteria bacterium GW2011_GWE1_36_7]|nr:MAG: hypothetical protein UR99_C0006G0019 [Candidatus Moranbacteria bacterium GW2011_GWD2_36_12]KKQ07145.1 MAG: hypothetical protein US16_C0002G0019 [Candidatus Moranbacteria bacterium GW2011_GWE2_36_40]KKQ11785.1 MAG: hypothetical protein US25_C0073G0003 [Candidatus Moranbacteria bacterium GW2011_GWE1_36_7]
MQNNDNLVSIETCVAVLKHVDKLDLENIHPLLFRYVTEYGEFEYFLDNASKAQKGILFDECIITACIHVSASLLTCKPRRNMPAISAEEEIKYILRTTNKDDLPNISWAIRTIFISMFVCLNHLKLHNKHETV